MTKNCTKKLKKIFIRNIKNLVLIGQERLLSNIKNWGEDILVIKKKVREMERCGW